ncbi:MAG: hypothetical protein Q8L88_02470 [Bacteroidota bacterium]|nr:hypothetical protein [Bacteroidota bacterium]
MRRLKSFIIATMSLFSSVDFKKKKRVKINLKRNDHKILFSILDFIFDVRTNGDGSVTLNLKQRRKANYERGL